MMRGGKLPTGTRITEVTSRQTGKGDFVYKVILSSDSLITRLVKLTACGRISHFEKQAAITQHPIT